MAKSKLRITVTSNEKILNEYKKFLPDVYGKTYTRKCLKCDKSFLVQHKFTRMCDYCKEYQVLRGYTNDVYALKQ